MNQYPGMPPAGPVYPTQPHRRQDPHYTSSPHPHYVPFYAPSSPHPGPIPYGPPPQFIPQWYPYQQFSYPAPQQPRHYPNQSPLVVSSTSAAQPVYPLNRHQQFPPQQPPLPAPTPQPDQSTTSITTQPVVPPSTTPLNNSDHTATPPILPTKDAPEAQRKPFSLQLPWYSVPESSFPARALRRRRKRRTHDALPDTPSLPSFPRQRTTLLDTREPEKPSAQVPTHAIPPGEDFLKPTSTTPEQSTENNPQLPPTPQSAAPTDAPIALPQRKRAPTRPVVPVIPNLPRRPGAGVTSPPSTSNNHQPSIDGVQQVQDPETKQHEETTSSQGSQPAETAPASPKKAPPKSWAELLRNKNSVVASASTTTATVNGATSADTKRPLSQSLSDALRSYEVDNAEKISFLEPRGLVNTGNICYMNSILQVLIFCVPFFELLDRVRKRAVHSFKSNTPLLEAMIMFMNEYNVIDSASSVDQLRLRLKDNELEQYGEAFIPEYVYSAIKQIPRFSSMRRGQQQDAEEFLGLLLEVLHLECLSVMDKVDPSSSESQMNGASPGSSNAENQGIDSSISDGWMEVQRHQRPAVTRSSGASTTSPITKIFGGALRSEFRVPGSKNSVTLTPYQQLQLDINDATVTNITQALKGLSKSERIDGQFATPRGTSTHGIKQVFIEDLPPMLILHLKRFHYDNVLGSTQKIWKRVGYPLDLEIPKEVFSQSKRAGLSARPQGLPKYRLSAVVYHHGKYAGGGHYTVDVRRQEGREWIRLDDTEIRRMRAEEVANEGGEEDPRILAAALERHKKEQQGRSAGHVGNPYTLQEDTDENSTVDGDGVDSEGWSQVNSNGMTSPPGSSAGNKKWSGVVMNGTAGTSSAGTATPTGKQTPRGARGAASNGKGVQTAAKDKVAYILFYERVQG